MRPHHWKIQNCPQLQAWLDAKMHQASLWLLVSLSTSQLSLTLLASFLRQAPLCRLSNLTKNNQLFLCSGIKISKENSHWVMCPSLTNLYGLGWGTLIGLAWLKPSTRVQGRMVMTKEACGWGRSSWKTKRSNTFLTPFLMSTLELVSLTFNPES